MMLAAAGTLSVGAGARLASAAPTVAAVEIVSPHALPRDQVLAAIGPLADHVFSRTAVRESLDRLWALGFFEEVRVEERPRGDGIALVYHLRRKPWLESLAWRGDLGLDRADLAAVARLPIGGDADDGAIARGRERVLAALQREGFLAARVEPEVEADSATNARRLTFSISAGAAARLGPVRITGAGRVPPGEIADASGLEEGARYRERAVKEGAEAATAFLRRRGFLDARVTAATTPLAASPGRVAVELRVVEGPRYEVQFTGNEALSAKELRRRAALEEQAPIDAFSVEAAAHALEDAYRERGYASATVRGILEEGPEVHLIRFEVTEGPRTTLSGVEITGSLEIPAEQLLDRMQLKPGRWIPTPFRADRLAADERALEAYLRAQGFADARVGPARLTWSADRREVRAEIPVVEGPRLHVGAIAIEGAIHVSAAEIRTALPFSSGGVWNPSVADEGERVIARLYERRGFHAAEISATTAREGGAVSVTYRIAEGPQTRIGRVLVRGALLTREATIRERLPFRPGDPYDPDRLLAGQTQLSDLGVFDRVDVEPLQPPATPFADVEVAVRERKPWRLEFGLGYATDEGGRGFVEIGYDNLFGTGRSLRLRQKLNGGGEVSAFGARTDLIYREPWALGTRWDGDARIFWEYRQVLGYDYERLGLRAALEGDLWREQVRGLTGSAWYRFYSINRFNINPELADSTIIPGTNRVASVAGALTLDRRDAPLDPRRGSLSFVSLETAAVPLGGNVSFLKGRLETAWVFSWPPPLVLALAARVGLAAPFAGSQDLPIEDRFYAGGANTVRGYREQRVGPLDANGDPTGGNGLIVLNAEYRFPIWRFFGGAVFVDAGQVTSTVGELAWSAFRVGVGGGLRLNTPVGPVRLDFGYALTPIPGENRFQVYLAIGNPF
jgi:outer membrane protein assembly complex protein YaeT